ncbi:lysine-specific demethylase 8-like isoform X2 [Dreissena polymorpha]|uniref:lysine-specific demethylase 8-like isoform X2 n=1 Tax=Dreissena polymorpha TaxID=45954 RepID=UPI0022642403|nr:lysine-specific demethylase 8-like isoform X2 [Dreissena polymorpha]
MLAEQKKVSVADEGHDAGGGEELLVDTALAVWWKRTGRHMVALSSLPSTDNPDTLIRYIAGTDEGLDFMQDEIKRLRGKLSKGSKNLSVPSALSSFYERLGNLSLAMMHLETVLQKTPEDKEAKWRHHRLERAVQYRQAQEERLMKMDHNSHSELDFPKPIEVDRVSCCKLSYVDFFHKYAVTSTPVIITGLSVTREPWTLEHIAQVAGNCKVTLKTPVKESVKWARLEDSETMIVREFIDRIHDKKEDAKPLYIFDWSLPIHCPDLAKGLTIPKYFAGDFLQRTLPGSLYQDSWPSLFVAPAGVVSDLHVDTFGSNFWMALFQGRKRWTFFPKSDTSLLYPVFSTPWGCDPNFSIDLSSPDMKQFPLLAQTSPIQCVLEPGEVLFVPAGCPHRVENLETSVAISGNYVDLSNIDLVKRELTLAGLLDERSCDLLEQFNNPDFPSNLWSEIDHLPYEEFKAWAELKELYEKFDITSKTLKEQKIDVFEQK